MTANRIGFQSDFGSNLYSTGFGSNLFGGQSGIGLNYPGGRMISAPTMGNGLRARINPKQPSTPMP